jgi:hypothetical protein
MSNEQDIQLLAAISSALSERNYTPETLIALLQESVRAQNHRNDALRSISGNPYHHDNEHSSSTTSSHTNQTIESHPNTPHYYTPQPTLFNAVIEACPIPNKTGTYAIFVQPKSPTGRPCLIECGDTVVIHPDYTVTWFLDSFYQNIQTVVYCATNEQAGVIRNLVIKHEWSEDMQSEDDDE